MTNNGVQHEYQQLQALLTQLRAPGMMREAQASLLTACEGHLQRIAFATFAFHGGLAVSREAAQRIAALRGASSQDRRIRQVLDALDNDLQYHLEQFGRTDLLLEEALPAVEKAFHQAGQPVPPSVQRILMVTGGASAA